MSKAYRIKNRLRRCRIESGLTQKEVASFLAMQSTAQVSRWERGERVPKLVHALRLSAIYNRMVNDLFFDYFSEERMRMEKRIQQKQPQRKPRRKPGKKPKRSPK